jgi:phosphate uptake regulator
VRTAFHEQFDSLTETLSEMCGMAGLAMERATRALLQADLAIAEAVISDHEHLARMKTGIPVSADDLDGIGGGLHGGIGGDEFGDAGLAAVRPDEKIHVRLVRGVSGSFRTPGRG